MAHSNEYYTDRYYGKHVLVIQPRNRRRKPVPVYTESPSLAKTLKEISLEVSRRIIKKDRDRLRRHQLQRFLQKGLALSSDSVLQWTAVPFAYSAVRNWPSSSTQHLFYPIVTDDGIEPMGLDVPPLSDFVYRYR